MTTTISRPPFEEHLRFALQGFRAALAGIIGEVGADATQPQALGRRLGLDKSLAWHLASILADDEPASIVAHLPGKAGMKIVVNRFDAVGASAEACRALQQSIDEIDRMVATHCGDRRTLEMMVGHLNANGSGAPQNEMHRKALYQGASGIWGVQTRVQVATHFVCPSRTDPDRLDLAVVSGLIGFRRLRPNVSWAVASVRRYAGDGADPPHGMFEPIDPNLDVEEAPLLAEFSSQPMPEMRVVPGPAGVTRYEIVEGPVGNTAACTAVTAWVWRSDVSPWRTEEDRFGEHFVNLNTPAKLLIHDLFVHVDVPFTARPSAYLYSQLPGGPTYPTAGRDRGRLPLGTDMTDLGAGPPDVIAPEIPRYQNLVELVCGRLGCSTADFAGYRLRLPYPPIPSLALFRYDLPERPDGRSSR